MMFVAPSVMKRLLVTMMMATLAIQDALFFFDRSRNNKASSSLLFVSAAPEEEDTCATREGVTYISCVQGSGTESPLVGTTVTIEGIVVGDFQNDDADTTRNLGGFFVQEEDVDVDENPQTSEGIFVFDRYTDNIPDVNIGDLVRVSGTVAEAYGMTQLSGANLAVEILGSDESLPTAASVSLPSDLEQYEGMLVEFTEKLTYIENYNLGRYNTITLIQGDRPYQYAQIEIPDADGYAAYQEDVEGRQIMYDDGNNAQNVGIANLDGFGPVYNTATANRLGDTIEGLTGVLAYMFGNWNVESAMDGKNVFVSSPDNARPTQPKKKSGEYTLASVNVLNYFITLDEDGKKTTNGQSPRGADNQEEFDRQTEKLVTALMEYDADIFGFLEMENDFEPGSQGNAIEYLVMKLNEAIGKDVYDYVYPGQQFVDNSDAISSALMYKKTTFMIEQDTTFGILNDSVLSSLGLDFENGVFDGMSTNRASIITTFSTVSGNDCLTVMVNHLKSKGSVNPAPGNENKGDGAANNNAIRVQAAQSIVEYLKTSPTGSDCENIAILGDFNAYAKEDPIQTIEAEGYVNAETAFAEDYVPYSYVFDGQIGTLDYALVNDAFFRHVISVDSPHYNSDEDASLDYNFDFGRDRTYFDGSVPYRSSDHDPILLEFSFENTSKSTKSGKKNKHEKGNLRRNDKTMKKSKN